MNINETSMEREARCRGIEEQVRQHPSFPGDDKVKVFVQVARNRLTISRIWSRVGEDRRRERDGPAPS